jgi:hypothetical protein
MNTTDEIIQQIKYAYYDNPYISNLISNLDDSDEEAYFENLMNIVERDQYVMNIKEKSIICILNSKQITEQFDNLKIKELSDICEILLDIAKTCFSLNHENEQYLLGSKNMFEKININSASNRDYYLSQKMLLDTTISLEYQDVPKIFAPLFEDFYKLNVLIQNLDSFTEAVLIKQLYN